jgi:hypothetical protein
MQTFEVGKPFPLPFHQEGVLALFTGGALHICVILPDPTEEETESFLHGAMTVGLFIKNNCIFITPKFGDLVIGDCTINGAIEPKEKFDMFVEVVPAERTGALFFLIDLNGGIVRGIRYISYEERFVEKLQWALLAQKENPPNQHWTMTIHTIYQQYSTDALFDASEHFRVQHISLSDRTTVI